MPLSNSISSQFRVYLPKAFILPGTRDRFDSNFRNLDFTYEDMVDYVNGTITGARLPGIEDQGSDEQVYDKGIKRTFKGSIPVAQLVEKELTISFKLKDGFLNWYILYINFMEYLNFKQKRLWMPDVTCQLMDFETNIIGQLIFREPRIIQVEGIDLTYADNGVNSRDFNMRLGYTHIEFEIMHGKTLNPRKGDTSSCD